MRDAISLVFKLLVMFCGVQNTVAEVGRFEYVVDCSACYSTPIQGVDVYTCKARCEVQGECQNRNNNIPCGQQIRMILIN